MILNRLSFRKIIIIKEIENKIEIKLLIWLFNQISYLQMIVYDEGTDCEVRLYNKCPSMADQ